MFSLKQKATQTAKRAGIVVVGSLLCAVGVAFLTLAGWIQLIETFTPVVSSLIVAAVYFGVGLLMIGLSKDNSDPVETMKSHAATPQEPSDAPPIMQAFLYGMQAGANAKKSGR